MERLNADIVFKLCCYLDLGSMACLSAALPQWSSLISVRLRKRIWAIKVRILPQHTTVEYCSILNKDRDNEDSTGMNVESCEWEGLHDSTWEHVPFIILKIAIFDVFQFGPSVLPEKLNKILQKIRTSQLFLKFEDPNEARNVLQMGTLNSGCTVYIHELAFHRTKEPMLQGCDLASVGDLRFSGDIHLGDLSLLFTSDIPSLCVTCGDLSESCAPLVRKYIRAFLDGAVRQRSCRLSASGILLRKVFEAVAGSGETLRSSGQRRVEYFDDVDETSIHCSIEPTNCT